jgi:activating signal cointegrator complex subunit 1
LTHFLCLPLLTPTSTPQLRASIAHLQSAIEAREPEAKEGNGCTEAEPQRKTPRLVPRAAFRPLGTLHLTLGVMSLKGPGQLQGALELLGELDVEGMLREVSEEVSNINEVTVSEDSASAVDGRQSAILQTKAKENNTNPSWIKVTDPDEGSTLVVTTEKSDLIHSTTPPPFSRRPSSQKSPASSHPSPLLPLFISLRGLSPLPVTTPNNCTVLYTPPHDPSSRLLPLCHRLLHPFRKAGYILPSPTDRGGGDDLTLHTTLINTVYAKNDRRSGEQGRRSNRVGKLAFDATDLLELFNEKKGCLPACTTNSIDDENNDNTNAQTNTSATADPNQSLENTTPQESRSTFTFASCIPIDRVQICEMGAKKLDPDDDPEGLGQRYVVVGEKEIIVMDGSQGRGEKK